MQAPCRRDVGLLLLLLPSKVRCGARSADGVTRPARLWPLCIPLVVLPAGTFSHLLCIHLLRPEVVRPHLLPDARLGTLGLLVNRRLVGLEPLHALDAFRLVLEKVCTVWSRHSLLWMTNIVVVLMLLLLLLLVVVMLLLSVLPNLLRVSPLVVMIVVVVNLLVVLLLMPSVVVMRLKLGSSIGLRRPPLLRHSVPRWFLLRISQETFTLTSLGRVLGSEVQLLSATVVHSFRFWGSICIKRLAAFALAWKSLLVHSKCPRLPARGEIGR